MTSRDPNGRYSSYPTRSQRIKFNKNKIEIKLSILLNSLAQIYGNGYKDINEKTVVSIKPLPLVWPKASNLSRFLIKLEKLVHNSTFQSSPTQWMIKKRIIPQPSCPNCKTEMSIQEENGSSDDRIDNFWICGCGVMKSLKLPFSFNKMKSIRKVFSLIYCWSSRDENVESSLSVLEDYMISDTYSVYRSLQSLCGRIINRDHTKLASFDGHPVEVVSIKLGHLFVLTVMETKTKAIRITCFDQDEIIDAAHLGVNLFVDKCRKWIAVPSEVLICEMKFESLVSYGYKISFATKKDFLKLDDETIENSAGSYIIFHLKRMLKNINLNSLDCQSMKLILYELEWREKYGYDPYTAFQNINTHLATDPLDRNCIIEKIKVDAFYKNSKQLDDDWIKKNSEFFSQEHELSIDPRLQWLQTVANQQDSYPCKKFRSKVDEYYIDEYFYGWWYPLNGQIRKSVFKPVSNIICILCQMNFCKANISRHIIEHLINPFSNCSLIRILCSHCFKDFSPEEMHLHRELISTNMISSSCRICCVSFYERSEYLKHMKSNHWPREAPYACPICKYRSSFQRDVLIHFDKYHFESKSILCPVCLKLVMFDSLDELSVILVDHINEHVKIGSTFSCFRCTLTFINEIEKVEHLIADHGNPSNYQQNFVPYRLKDKEIDLSTIVNRDELLSPSVVEVKSNQPNGHFYEKKNGLSKQRLTLKKFNQLVTTLDLTCMECKKKVQPKHFSENPVVCIICNMESHCKFAVKNHICLHSARTSHHKSPAFICLCKRKFTEADKLVEHMALAKHFTCKCIL